jgi:hypothetical protein
MKRHGILDSKYKSGLKNLEFAKELFTIWDKVGRGQLEISQIIRPLVALGLSPDGTFVTKLLQALDVLTEVKEDSSQD